MKTYKINSCHTVHEDSYKEGLQDHVQTYSLEAEIKANTPQEALQKYIEDFLCYDYSPTDIDIDLDDDLICTGWLVNEDNCTPTAKQVKQWKHGECILYANDVIFDIYEITPIYLESLI